MNEPPPPNESACALCTTRSAGARPHPSIGMPFRECLRCGRSTDRAGVDEWDLHERRARLSLVGRRAGLAVALGFVFPLAHGVVALATTRPWELRFAVWFLAVGWVTLGSIAALWLLAEIHRSRRRVAFDPMYRLRLAARSISDSRSGRAPGAPAARLEQEQAS